MSIISFSSIVLFITYLSAFIKVSGTLHALQVPGALYVLVSAVVASADIVITVGGAGDAEVVIVAGPLRARVVEEALVIVAVVGVEEALLRPGAGVGLTLLQFYNKNN